MGVMGSRSAEPHASSSSSPAVGSHVHFGCGYCAPEGWLNFDCSPTLRIERMPVLGRLLGRLSGNAERFPRQVRVGDIRRGLPVPDGSVRAAYASHVLEHLSLEDCRAAIANTYRMLAPGGVFRLIVPDLLERARRYVAAADARAADAAGTFMQSTYLGAERRPRTALGQLRGMVGNSAHLWMWDEHAMTAELARAGFVAIRRCALGDAEDRMFDRVEHPDRFHDPDFDIPEVALEARKPA
jgi:hypothetical protein